MFEKKNTAIRISKKDLERYNMSNSSSWGWLEICIVGAIIGLLVLVGFASCRPTPVSETNVNDFKVHLLFENDGIKMYRFKDGIRTVYYSDARGVTSWEEQQGKTTVRRQVETVQ